MIQLYQALDAGATVPITAILNTMFSLKNPSTTPASPSPHPAGTELKNLEFFYSLSQSFDWLRLLVLL